MTYAYFSYIHILLDINAYLMNEEADDVISVSANVGYM